MLHLLQFLSLLDSNDKQLFIALFNDLSFEIEELGYEGFEDELVNDMLANHFGMSLNNDTQLGYFTKAILSNQGRLDKVIPLVK